MTLDTSRPRAAGGYDFSQHGRPSAGSIQSMILLPNAPAELWQSSWQNTLTTFRPLPAIGDDGQLTPFRRSNQPDAFGDWVRGYLVFKGGVNGMVSFILYDPVANPEYDLNESPAYSLWNSINRTVNAGQGHPSWVPHLKFNGRGTALAKPTTNFFTQALLFEHKSKVLQWPRGAGPNDKALVMQLSQDAGRKMLEQFNAPNPQAPQGSTNTEELFLHGNAVDYAFGRFVRTCQTGGALTAAPQGQQNPLGAYGNIGSNQQQSGGGNDGPKGYDVRIERTFVTPFQNTPAAIPDHLQTVLTTRARRWSEVLRIPTDAEQVLALARAYPGDMIEFAFREHPHWLTSEITQITRARTTVPQAGGFPQAAGYTPPQGGYPQQGAPQGYPQSQAGYPQQGYAPPAGYPQQGYQQPAPGQAAPGQQAAYMAPGYPQPDQQVPTTGFVNAGPAAPPTQPNAAPGAGVWGGTGFGGAPGNAGIPGVDPALNPGSHAMPGGYPGQPPQGYPQGPQGPQGQPQGYPQQGQPQGYPQGQPQGQPQGYPQGQLQGYPQGQPQGYPQGVPGQNGNPPLTQAFGPGGVPGSPDAAVQAALAAAQNVLGGAHVGAPPTR